MPVIDASVLVPYLIHDEGTEALGERIRAGIGSLIAPHLVDAEVGHTLRRLVAARKLNAADAEHALVDLADLPLERAGHAMLLPAAWQLRSNVSFYDALYLALARELDAEFLTLDARLARAATAAKVQVELLAASD